MRASSLNDALNTCCCPGADTALKSYGLEALERGQNSILHITPLSPCGAGGRFEFTLGYSRSIGVQFNFA